MMIVQSDGSNMRWPRAMVLLLALVMVIGLVSSPLLVALSLFLVLVLALPFTRTLTVVYFAMVLGAVVPLSEWPLQLLAFKLYGADALAFFLLSMALSSTWKHAATEVETFVLPRTERVLMALLGGMFVWGLVAAVKGGVWQHYPVNDVLGDLRRLYVYPLAMLIPVHFAGHERELRRLSSAIMVAGGLLFVLVGYRFFTGISYHEAYFTARVYEPRWMAASETSALQMIVAFFSGSMIVSRSPFRKALHGFLAAVSISLLFISGWRLAVIMAFLVPLTTLVTLTRMKRSSRGMLLKSLGAGFVLTLFVSAILIWVIPDLAFEHVERLVRRFAEVGEGDGRYYVWKAALVEFSQGPILGTGLGHQLFHYFRSSDGAWLGRVMTTHNYPLDILYQTGLPGFILFVCLHGTFNWYVWRKRRRVPEPFQVAFTALFLGYWCNLLTHSLEPSLPAGIVALYMAMGFMLCILRLSNDDAGGRGAARPSGNRTTA